MKRYDEVITLKLAAFGSAGVEARDMGVQLGELVTTGYRLAGVSQPVLEWAYAVLDDAKSEILRAEWSADPRYLVDLRLAVGVCPLCDHKGLRWLFKIRNSVTQEEIECGSECIISHGMHVEGAATSAEAKKLLEKAIRRRIRELEIQRWMAETGWFPGCLDIAEEALFLLPRMGSAVKPAYAGLCDKLAALRRYFERWGWIGSPVRWATWCALVKTLKGAGLGELLPAPIGWSVKPVIPTEEPVAPAVPTPAPLPQPPAPLVTSVDEVTSAGQLDLFPSMGVYNG